MSLFCSGCWVTRATCSARGGGCCRDCDHPDREFHFGPCVVLQFPDVWLAYCEYDCDHEWEVVAANHSDAAIAVLGHLREAHPDVKCSKCGSPGCLEDRLLDW